MDADKLLDGPLAWAVRLLKDSGFCDAAETLERKADAALATASKPGGSHGRQANEGTAELSTCVTSLRMHSQVRVVASQMRFAPHARARASVREPLALRAGRLRWTLVAH